MKMTREGKRFILAAFLIAVAAVNTGNNLIYLILALMFSLALLSVLLLRINLSGLSLEVSFDGHVFAGEVAYATVLVRNSKRFIPSYSFRIAVEGAVSPVYCGIVSPGGTLEKVLRLRFERRGLYGGKDFFVVSGFPFILMSGRKAAGTSEEILVYPELVETGGLIEGNSGSSGAEAVMKGRSGDEIYSIREYQYGDDQRRIHWKATAKTGDLMVKEFTEGEFRKATIVIDNLLVVRDTSGYDDTPGRGDVSSSWAFEKAVCVAGSLARDLIEDGYLVRMMSCRKVVSFGTGTDHLFRILGVLAVLREEPSWDGPTPGGDDLFVFVFKSRGAPSLLPFAAAGMAVYADSL